MWTNNTRILHIMEKEEQQRKLKKWSAETVKFYLEQVEQVNQDGKNDAPSFYNQSDLSRVDKCELMIIGINPGCGSLFSEWKYKDKITSDFLYKGNPCFEGKSDQEIIDIMSIIKDEEKKRKGWDLWHKIHRMLVFSEKGGLLETLDKFVMTNMVFFGTAEQDQIPKGVDREKCAEKTLQLIDILAPKVVLLLGEQSRQLFEKVAKITHMEELVPGYHVFYCFNNNRHIIAIYHTAYYKYYTNHNNMAVIGKTIGYALDNSSKRIEKQNLESYLSELINDESKNRINETSSKLIERIRELKKKIKANGSKQWIYNRDTLVHEYYTDIDIKTGKYKNSRRNIAIDLCPNYKDNEYWIKVFTRENDKSQSEIIAKEALGIEYVGCPDNPNRLLYARIPMSESNEKIVETMNDLLKKIKDYRDKKYKK